MAIRFDAVANIIITSVASLIVADSLLGTTTSPALSAGLAGVVLTQSLQLIGVFQYGVRQAAETENNMTSVERIRAYGSLRQEGRARRWEGASKPELPEGWPRFGRLELRDVSMRYRPVRQFGT